MNRLIAALLILGAVFGAGFALNRPEASAAGPCSPATAGVSAEENQFLGLLQQWRNANISGSVPLQLSGPLNRAAAWYAEYQVANGLQGGHTDNLGRNWAQRALDCGYDQFWSQGSGEGIYARAGSSSQNIGPTEAMSGITYPGSGVYITTPPTYSSPAKCVGVAVARNANSTAVAWVVVIAQYPGGQSCPEAGGSIDPGNPTSTRSTTSTTSTTTTTSTVSSTPTKTATPTPTSTPTPSPTPSPTPNANYGGTLSIATGWNLVTLPAGPLDDILDTARGCFNAIYQQQGDHWLRYSPLVPAWANNLTSSNGSGFWIDGTGARGCANIRI